MSAAVAWFSPLVLAQAAAGAPAERPDEADMFGAPADASAPASASAPTSTSVPNRDTDTLSGAPLMRGDIRAEVSDDKLEIGGDLLLRFQSTLATDTDLGDQGFSAPSLLDIYLDARPSDRVRVYAEGRFTYDPTLENGRARFSDPCSASNATTKVPPNETFEQRGDRLLCARFAPSEPVDCSKLLKEKIADCIAAQAAQARWTGAANDALAQAFATPAETSGLTQLWLKFDAAQSVFFTLGRQPVKWGAARLWNPTDFVNRQSRDPLQQIDLRPGVSLVKVHVPWESQAANFYALGLLDEADRLGDLGGAVRAEWALSTAELSLSAAGRRDSPLLLGADFSLGLWQLDLYGEGAVAHGNHKPLPGETDRSDDWIPHVAGGVSWQVDYGDQDTLTWGLEYTFNDGGVDDPAQFGNALADGRSVFALPRQAAGAYVVLLAPGRLDDSSVFLTALASLDDMSGTARLQWSERVLTWLSVQPYVGGYFGQAGDLFAFDLNAAGASAGATPAYLTADAGVWLSAKL